MSESTHEPAGDGSWSAPASDAEEQTDDRGAETGAESGAETGTPFASDGGTDLPGARTDGPSEPDEPQREE